MSFVVDRVLIHSASLLSSSSRVYMAFVVADKGLKTGLDIDSSCRSILSINQYSIVSVSLVTSFLTIVFRSLNFFAKIISFMKVITVQILHPKLSLRKPDYSRANHNAHKYFHLSPSRSCIRIQPFMNHSDKGVCSLSPGISVGDLFKDIWIFGKGFVTNLNIHGKICTHVKRGIDIDKFESTLCFDLFAQRSILEGG